MPFLHVVSLKVRYGYDFVFGELKHEIEGLIDDYMDLFNLERSEQVVATIELIGMKKRLANKESYPCDCSNRLGKCRLNNIISEYRELIPKSRFKK